MLRTLSLAGLWQWKQTLEPDEGRYYASIRSLETTVIFEYVTTLLLLILPVKPTPYITIIVWNMKKKKKNGAPCFRKLIFWSQKFRHLKTITYKSMQNCWYSTFDIKEALNERKKCYQNLFSNERIFKQKKTYGLPMNQQVPTVRGPDRLQIHGAAKWMNQWTAPVINWSRQSYSM